MTSCLLSLSNRCFRPVVPLFVLLRRFYLRYLSVDCFSLVYCVSPSGHDSSIRSLSLALHVLVSTLCSRRQNPTFIDLGLDCRFLVSADGLADSIDSTRIVRQTDRHSLFRPGQESVEPGRAEARQSDP